MSLTSPGNLPYVTLYHNQTPYNFLIDTGSTLSWTTPEVSASMLLNGKEVSTGRNVFDWARDSYINATLRLAPTTDTEEDNVAQKFRVKLWSGIATPKIKDMNKHVDNPIHGILGVDFILSNVLSVNMDTLKLYL